jgi:hypothetical protein
MRGEEGGCWCARAHHHCTHRRACVLRFGAVGGMPILNFKYGVVGGVCCVGVQLLPPTSLPFLSISGAEKFAEGVTTHVTMSRFYTIPGALCTHESMNF